MLWPSSFSCGLQPTYLHCCPASCNWQKTQVTGLAPRGRKHHTAGQSQYVRMHEHMRVFGCLNAQCFMRASPYILIQLSMRTGFMCLEERIHGQHSMISTSLTSKVCVFVVCMCVPKTLLPKGNGRDVVPMGTGRQVALNLTPCDALKHQPRDKGWLRCRGLSLCRPDCLCGSGLWRALPLHLLMSPSSWRAHTLAFVP